MNAAHTFNSRRLKSVADIVIGGMIRSEGSYELSPRALGVLIACDVSHTVRALAVDLKIPKPSVSRSLDDLVARGFVTRQVDPTDRRSVIVKRTAAGEVELERIATATFTRVT